MADAEVPQTKYARSEDGFDIAYQVWGRGDLTLVTVQPVISAIELSWEEPRFEHYVRGLGSISRVIHFDKRGSGASDRVAGAPTLERGVDDLRVM